MTPHAGRIWREPTHAIKKSNRLARRLEEAEQTLREALPNAKRPEYVFCFLALTSLGFEREPQAREWLDKVEHSLATEKNAWWATHVTVQLLRKQAIAAIDG